MTDFVEIARCVISNEIEGLNCVSRNVSASFEHAVMAIANAHGRTIICGMGKSGIIGRKIAASLASTGTPSFFMHPGEAFHGDLGMVQSEDVFIAISNSGETDEVLKLLPFLRDNKNIIISLTGNAFSTLAVSSHYHIDISVPSEACPLQLAPTTSTTATLVMGDALTVALMHARDFKPENFARFHPGGSLGRRLLSKVRDFMVKEPLPFVYSDDCFSKVIEIVSGHKLGVALIKTNGVVGSIITDGDLRRAMEKHGKDAFDLTAEMFATRNPLFVSPDASMQSAIELMESRGITTLIVRDLGGVVGILKK